jgi:hypothetical protein
MNKTAFDVGFDDDTTGLLDDSPHVAAAPYPGGRAQAESGSKIIENDYYGWLAQALQPDGLEPSHPRIVQLGQAWRAVSRLGLGDDPGAASIRYQILAHAAGALIQPVRDQDLADEADALATLRQHALIHGHRLHATSTDLFIRSGKSGPYTGHDQAAAGSRIIEQDYQQWNRLQAAALAAIDPGLREQAENLNQAWTGIEHHGLADGHAPAAARYHTVAGYARNLAQDFSYQLPSAALTPLLELALHADKHSIRLHNTAIARTDGPAAGYEALCQATWERAVPGGTAAAYRDLPDQVTTTTVRAHSGVPHAAGTSLPAGNGTVSRSPGTGPRRTNGRSYPATQRPRGHSAS